MLPLAMFLLWCRLPLFSPQRGGWNSRFLMGVWGLSCNHSGEYWVSVHCGRQEFWGLLARCWLPGAQLLLQSWENKAYGQQEPWGLFAGKATRSHSSCCRHGGTKPSGSGCPEACLPGASFQELQELLQARGGDTSLWAVGTQEPACRSRLPRATAPAAGMGDPSLWAVGVLGPARQVPASRSYRSFCNHWRTKPVGSGSPGVCLLVQAFGRLVQQLLLAWGTKPAGLP
jgi:hypothetical protein